MSYLVRDMLFVDLTEEEAAELRRVADDALLRGTGSMTHHAFIEWKRAIGLTDDQAMVCYSTAYIPRLLMSLLQRLDKPKRCYQCGGLATETCDLLIGGRLRCPTCRDKAKDEQGSRYVGTCFSCGTHTRTDTLTGGHLLCDTCKARVYRP